LQLAEKADDTGTTDTHSHEAGVGTDVGATLTGVAGSAPGSCQGLRQAQFDFRADVTFFASEKRYLHDDLPDTSQRLTYR
jgi:hypothetical protein